VVGLKNCDCAELIDEIGDEFDEEVAFGEDAFKMESLFFCDDVDEVEADDDQVSKVFAVESIPICVGV